MQPPREEDIDHVCSNCGRVVSGPHAGETVHSEDVHVLGGRYDAYKNAPISHTVCDDCQGKSGGFHEQMRDRKLERAKQHPWWRKLGERDE